MPSPRPTIGSEEKDLSGRSFRGANLVRQDLSGRDLSRADLSRADLRLADLTRARATGADLTDARLRRAILVEANLEHATLRGVDLVDANLREANLDGADLSGALLDHASLEGASLAGARLAHLALSRVNFRRATLRGADLSGALLESGELTEADLSEAKLVDADLTFANLQGASLRGADLTSVDLSGANLDRADLRDAKLEGARLYAVQGIDPRARRELLDRGARLPLGLLPRGLIRLDALARRRAGLLYASTTLVGLAVAIAVALVAARSSRQTATYALSPPQSGVLYEVDCGGLDDHAWNGRTGFFGGDAERARFRPEEIQRAEHAPREVYLTAHVGFDFDYRFRAPRGWYELELHFVEAEHTRRGSRIFNILVEGLTVAQHFDILVEAPPKTVVVRRFAVYVKDGRLDVHFSRRQGRAKVDYIRVRRMELPGPAAPERDEE
jgi:uncharacterized protein YjbI with pentapeptide repeats